MVKSRNFRIGFGLGVIAGALLLQLLLAGERQQERLMTGGESSEGPVQERTYTQEEVTELLAQARSQAAAEAGQGAASGSVTSSGAASAANAKSETASSPAAKSESDTASSTAANAGSETASSASAPSAVKAESVSEPAAKAESRPDGKTKTAAGEQKTVIRIPPSSGLTQAASILKENGLIADGADFVAYMKKQGESGSIRAGYFLFEGRPSLDRVRATITGEPLPPAEGKEWMTAGGASP